jgi:hypothetical protein
MNEQINTSFPKGKLANFRDLGGYPSGEKVVKKETLFRADDISSIDDENCEFILQKGITRIIDLRSPAEVEVTGRGPLGNHEIEYYNRPLLADPAGPHQLMEQMETDVFTPEILGLWYDRLFDESIEIIIDTLKIVGDSTGPLVFHCAAGKDRTGIIAACILSILEVDKEVITHDYALTQRAMPDVLGRLITNDKNIDPEFIEKAGALLEAPAVAMDILQSLSEEKHGGILERLKRNGLTDSTIENYRNRFLSQSI